MLAEAGNDKVTDVSVTAGCANPVGPGAQVEFDNLTINNKIIDFN